MTKRSKRAGAQGIYVCTGHGFKHLPELPAEEEVIVPDLRAATEWLLSLQRFEAYERLTGTSFDWKSTDGDS
jgi:hypothetical protein